MGATTDLTAVTVVTADLLLPTTRRAVILAPVDVAMIVPVPDHIPLVSKTSVMTSIGREKFEKKKDTKKDKKNQDIQGAIHKTL